MLLSVLLPSNRDLASSRRSIETALRFCEMQDAKLIVSDNSRDPEKRRLLERASPRLVYTVPEKDGLHANLFNVYAAADTEFILMMGDDDELFVSPKDKPVDLTSIPADFMGIRPMIAVANGEGRVVRLKTFGLMEETPGARVMAYNEHAGGDNTAYYSIFRRKPFIDLHRFFLTEHPLKGGYSDWALACVLFSYGKFIYDPGVIYKYNLHQWDEAEKITARRLALFEEAGLPPSAERFGLLLLYLDMLILARRKASPLDEAGKRSLIVEAGQPILAGFCNRVLAERVVFGEAVHAAAAAMLRESDAEAQFDLALGATEFVQSGLSARYRAFNRLAIQAQPA